MAETVNEDGSKTYSIGQRQVAKTQPDKKNGKKRKIVIAKHNQDVNKNG